MKICFDIKDSLNRDFVKKLTNEIEKTIDFRTKYFLAEQKYQLPEWLGDKENFPLLSRKEIEELLELGLRFYITHGCGDYGCSINIELIDPESDLDIYELDYHPGWNDDGIDKILQVFEKFDCERIKIEELYY